MPARNGEKGRTQMNAIGIIGLSAVIGFAAGGLGGVAAVLTLRKSILEDIRAAAAGDQAE